MFPTIRLYLLSEVLSITTVWRVETELYSALVDMEPLLDTQKRTIEELEAYLLLERKKLKHITWQLEIYKREHEKAMLDIPSYLGNPLNCFTLIKRLTIDILRMEFVNLFGSGLTHPEVTDLIGAAEALTRLQTTYDMNTEEMADGRINGVEYSSPLSASDCFEIGRSLYYIEDYNNTAQWMVQALRKLADEDPELLAFSKPDAIEYIALSYYLLGQLQQASYWDEQLKNLNIFRGSILQYKKSVGESQAAFIRLWGLDASKRWWVPQPSTLVPPEIDIYRALCRGDTFVPDSVAKKLKCRYVSEHHPFLKIAPFKMEEMYLEPNLLVFYDVISDGEIEVIEMLARPRFRRAKVHSIKGQLVPAQYRISKSAWLKDHEARAVAAVSRRVAHMTGLSVASAEELQVVNYGIGGHYEPHVDFFAKTSDKFVSTRIATVIFYMSDVTQAGATVFTALGTRVAPVKGAAAFWMNLHRSGEGDWDSVHAACPILRGSKWVATKWLHQTGQELIYPCDLSYQPEE